MYQTRFKWFRALHKQVLRQLSLNYLQRKCHGNSLKFAIWKNIIFSFSLTVTPYFFLTSLFSFELLLIVAYKVQPPKLKKTYIKEFLWITAAFAVMSFINITYFFSKWTILYSYFMLTHQMEQGLIKLSRKTRCWWRGYNQSLEWFICQGTHQKCKIQKLLKTKQFLLLHDGTKCVTNVRKCSVDCWTVASDWTTSSFWFYLQFLTWFYLLQQRVTSSFLNCIIAVW